MGYQKYKNLFINNKKAVINIQKSEFSQKFRAVSKILFSKWYDRPAVKEVKGSGIPPPKFFFPVKRRASSQRPELMKLFMMKAPPSTKSD